MLSLSNTKAVKQVLGWASVMFTKCYKAVKDILKFLTLKKKKKISSLISPAVINNQQQYASFFSSVRHASENYLLPP